MLEFGLQDDMLVGCEYNFAYDWAGNSICLRIDCDFVSQVGLFNSK